MKLPIYVILLLFVLLEVSSHSILIDLWGAQSASIIYLLSGLLIVICALLPVKRMNLQSSFEGKSSISIILLINILLALLFHHYAALRFEEVAINYRVADMLPVIDIMSQRFLEGEEVYGVIPEIWGGMQPIYLPALWMPYVLHHLFNFDMRWVSVFLIVIGTLSIYWLPKRENYRNRYLAVITLPIILLWSSILTADASLITITQEGVVIGYYLLVGFSLVTERWKMLGLGIGLCLMSRYALGPWLICFVPALFLFGKTKQAIKVFVSTILTILILFLTTQAYSQFSLFLELPHRYLEAVINDQSKYQSTLQNSLGLAKFFDYSNLAQLHFLFKLSAFLVPIIGFFLYPFFKSRLPFSFYALIVLKLSLVGFYNLLILPYSYLFYTSTFLSIMILSGYFLLSEDNKFKNAHLSNESTN